MHFSAKKVVDGAARILAEGRGLQGTKDEDGFHVDSEDLLRPMDMVRVHTFNRFKLKKR